MPRLTSTPATAPARGSAAGQSTGSENPSGRIWFRRLRVWLVVPDRYCDRGRSTRRRFAGYGIPTPVSECPEGDVGLADRNVKFRQPVVDLPIDCESVC